MLIELAGGMFVHLDYTGWFYNSGAKWLAQQFSLQYTQACLQQHEFPSKLIMCNMNVVI